MMLIVSQIIGFAAVALFLLSFQLKRRQQIVWVTCASNLLYVLQYCLLGAFSGAVLDVLSTVSSFFAGKKHAPNMQRHRKAFAALTLGLIAVAGVALALLQKDWIELIPVAGALLQAGSLWRDDEQAIRLLSLFGSPFWLVYNYISQAYGAALGSVLSIVSIIVGLLRYRKKQNAEKD